MTYKATIYNWEIRDFGECHVIVGTVSKVPDANAYKGDTIRTSNIELLNLKDGWVKTRNSFYRLENKNDN